MLEDLCFAYWGGGIGNHKLDNLKGVIDVLKKEHIPYKDIPNTQNARLLILNDLLNDVPIVDSDRKNFFQFANEQFGEGQTSTRSKFYKEYNELVKAQDESTREHYRTAKRLLEKELPKDVQYWVVAGRHDTNGIVEVFGDRVMHAPHPKHFGPWNFVGIPSLDNHDMYVAKELQLRSEAPAGKATAEEFFLAKQPGALKSHVIVTNDLLRDGYAKELNHPVQGRHGAALSDFVNNRWLDDKPRKRKLVITPAKSNGWDSEIAEIPAGRVLNTGEQAGKHGLYIVHLSADGFQDATPLFLDGRIGKKQKVSGHTYTAHDTRGYSATEHKVATKYAQSGTCKKSEEITKKLKRAKKPDQLEDLAEHSVGLEKVLKQNKSLRKSKRALSEDYKELSKDYRSEKRRNAQLERRFAYVGNSLMEEEHDKEAIVVYRVALQEVPEKDKKVRGIIMHNIGAAYENMGKLNDALQMYQDAMSLQPRSKEIRASYKRCDKKASKK